MEFFSGHIGREREISGLFSATFTASEGAEEGKIIGRLVDELMETTPDQDLLVFSAYDDQTLVGCIFFSRLNYEQDDRTVFILSPVAVKTDRQRKGVGQKLIAYGLDELRQKGIDIAVTYGDPNYYSRVGFRPITEEFAQAPLKLNQPHGWLGLSLSGMEQEPLSGPSRCVEALDKPELW
ncbi:GNAT family N-acetyltransferase [Hoeflea sp. TYP-13]|uniref:GNAT family N-acetyltransferase n=1 Tax=Hoeflea sp. TYP-13 TaxID=3230023 RepID=UPI0034C5E7EC